MQAEQRAGGRSDFTADAAKGAPFRLDLETYPVKEEGGRAPPRLR